MNRTQRLPTLLLCLLATTAAAQDDRHVGPATVQVEPLQLRSAYTVRRSYLGVVRARREAMAGFETGGLLAKMRVREGDTFVAGEELASLHTAMEQAAHELAQSQLHMSIEDRQLAEAAWQRHSRLDEAGHSAEHTMDEARHALAVSTAQLEVTRRRLRQAEVRLQQRSLLAPWDGAVQKRLLDEGSVVAPGQPVLHLVEVGALEAEINVSVRIGNRLNIGQLYDLWLGDRLQRVPLLRLSPALDSGSLTQQAFFALPPGSATPGAGTRLQVTVSIAQPGYWVPLQSLTQLRKGLWGVLVAVPHASGQGSALQEHIVEVIHIDRDFAYVNGTLQPGDPMVVSGAGDLVAGQQVQLRKMP